MSNSVVRSNEMEANKPANPESGEGQPELAISISDSFQGRLRILMGSDALVEQQNEGPLIGQVPGLLGMESELNKYFQPRIMTIGPLHNDKNKLEQGQQYKRQLHYDKNMIEQGQQVKHQLTKRFLKMNRQNNVTLCNNILKEIESFKKCYDQELLKNFHGNDEDLAWMFFEDGCALIEFVQSYAPFGWLGFYDMNIDRDQVNIMATDLILLVNQLPLGVLNLVMGFSERREPLTRSIHQFAEEIIEMIHFEGRAKDEKADSTTDWSFDKENHLLELIWKKLVKQEAYYGSANTKATPRQFRSVKELQVAGIILEPNNSSTSLRDISFSGGTFFCKLKIPAFRVSEEGKFLVFNLIAFEMHPNFGKDKVVTSYISFLNSLIATKEDIAELRKAGILINYLQNDDDVVKTFQELTSNLKPYSDIFSSTKKELIDYFNDKKRMTTGKWFSEAMHVYFRSPWTTIAFVSATILLIMTIIQAIFSILAYFNASLNLTKNGKYNL